MIHFVTGGQMIRFRGEQSKWHDGELMWPGYKGFPVLASDYNVTDHPRVCLVHFFHSKLFDLSNEEDKKYYDWVNDRVVNGWFLLERKEIKGTDNVKVYMEWIQRYLWVVPSSAVAEEQLIENSYELASF